MFGHFPELIIILVIALIVFGPEKLPEVAANTGKMVREIRTIMNTAMNPVEEEVPDDFSSYYYESLARAGEEVPDSYEPEHITFDLDDEDEIGTEQGSESTPNLPDPIGGRAAPMQPSSTGGAVPASRRMVTRVVQPRSRRQA